MKDQSSSPYERRHSRWYEVILFSALFQFALGMALVVVLPCWLRWGNGFFDSPLSDVQRNTLLASGLAYTAVFWLLRRFDRFPGTRSLPFVIPTVLVAWAVVLVTLLFVRESAFSRQVLFYAASASFCWSFAGFILGRRYRVLKLAVVPFGRALDLPKVGQALFTKLDAPSLAGRRYDGVVADLQSEDLPAEWERFLAACTLAHIPVYHTKQLVESLTGRVHIEHLSENTLGTLLPSVFYSGCKRILETLAVLVAMPVWLPVMLITGLVIKLESEGPMFFIQERVGQGNRNFKVYKLRSMCKDSEKDGAQFASVNDMRITRVGRFIRKARLDEFPQFINVLKGDMSLIGPRPEQRTFVDQFDEEIPFYSYRHVVKPGITGWAQVVHGYAADSEATRIKVEHDFYYIKHFSPWLDLLIAAKTVKTVLTGFSAR